MRIPEFKPSSRFVDESRIPCLKAVVRNSSVPQVAKRLADKSVADSEFPIYLRGKDHTAISDWHMGVLRELFEQEKMPLALEQGLAVLKTDAYGNHNDADIETHGLLPFVWITCVVVDEVRQELIISLDGLKKINPHDSDMVIHRTRAGWEFDDRSYLGEYVSEVATDEFIAQLGDERATDDKTFLGKWVLDPDATAQLQELSGRPDVGASGLFSPKGYTLEFERGKYRAFIDWRINPLGALRESMVRAALRLAGKPLPVFCEYTNSEIHGSHLTIQAHEPGQAVPASMTYRLRKDNLILAPESLVLRRGV